MSEKQKTKRIKFKKNLYLKKTTWASLKSLSFHLLNLDLLKTDGIYLICVHDRKTTVSNIFAEKRIIIKVSTDLTNDSNNLMDIQCDSLALFLSS